MKNKVFAHVGSLMGGMVHNLNTPLMWVMGRAQLLEARNEKIETLKDLPEEEILKIKAKNSKDITSIQEGANKIDSILKSLGYKVQMINEGYTSIELKEFLEMETDFLMADMRFKHETHREIALDSRSHYVKGDYNVLSCCLMGIIDTILNNTEKGRTLRISLDNGTIRLGCPELQYTDKVKQEIENFCGELADTADVVTDTASGFQISLCMKDG
ncbi:MAG: HAMP domain-containing histidine kinase [Deltaproteobacteria bacterium]|nr:HAMP domain-containing histidine kinase [Deltaproteobacteria bacterium]